MCNLHYNFLVSQIISKVSRATRHGTPSVILLTRLGFRLRLNWNTVYLCCLSFRHNCNSTPLYDNMPPVNLVRILRKWKEKICYVLLWFYRGTNFMKLLCFNEALFHRSYFAALLLFSYFNFFFSVLLFSFVIVFFQLLNFSWTILCRFNRFSLRFSLQETMIATNDQLNNVLLYIVLIYRSL